MDFRLRQQLKEALGQDNRWFCSQAYGRMIDDPELLMRYFIKSGGASEFASRFENALSEDNRWFCSQFHCQDIRDPEILWNYYYLKCVSGPARGNDRRDNSEGGAGLNIAC